MVAGKVCSTPGCAKPDFHNGAHSFESSLDKRLCPYVAPTETVRPGNQFQHGIGFARMCMDDQFGTTLRLPEDLRSDGTGVFDATVLGKESTGKHVALVVDEKGEQLRLTAQDLTRRDVAVDWRPVSDAMLAEHKRALHGKSHDAAAKRAYLFVKMLGNETRSDQKVFSLDGVGSNREAYLRGFAGRTDEMPEFCTFELDPEVALSQQLLYGTKTVLFTGALVREKFGYGCHRAAPHLPPGIEYLITNRDARNTLISKEDCGAVVGLNLDYCGGIYGGRDIEEGQRSIVNVLSRLPNLRVLCLTFSKRHRPGLKHDFDYYARTPYGFRVEHTFDAPTDNQRVVSRVYIRDVGIPRTLRLPGWKFKYYMTKSKTAHFRSQTYLCVIKSKDALTGQYWVYCIDDDTDRWSFEPKDLDPHVWDVDATAANSARNSPPHSSVNTALKKSALTLQFKKPRGGKNSAWHRELLRRLKGLGLKLRLSRIQVDGETVFGK